MLPIWHWAPTCSLKKALSTSSQSLYLRRHWVTTCYYDNMRLVTNVLLCQHGTGLPHFVLLAWHQLSTYFLWQYMILGTYVLLY